jgi:hypothetical protein
MSSATGTPSSTPSEAVSDTPSLTLTSQEVALARTQDEVLLRENPGRFVLFPIEHDKVWEMYKKHQAAFWQASEIDLSHDTKDWVKLSEPEQHFIKVGIHPCMRHEIACDVVLISLLDLFE